MLSTAHGIFSPSNSGKSNLIKNLITRTDFGYAQFYKKNVFLFSPTIHIDPIWQNMDLPKRQLYDEWHEKLVESILHSWSALIPEAASLT
jgi:hypothetical protein